MKKKLIAFVFAFLSVFTVTSPSFRNTSDTAFATGFETYENADLGLPNYGDTLLYSGPDGGSHSYVGSELSNKSELKLSYKNGIENGKCNYWLGVGGYAVYVSAGATIRFLYLSYQPGNSAGDYARLVQIRDLIMKDDSGNALTSVMPNGYIFNDYVDATYTFDLSGEYAVVSFYVEYKGTTYYPYSGSTKITSVTYTNKCSGISDYKFRMATADGVNANIIQFRTQSVPGLAEFTNNGQFTYTAPQGSIIPGSSATTSGVPAGNDGSVLKVTGSNSANIIFDFAPGKIQLNALDSIVLRIYANVNAVSGTYPEFRIKIGESWTFNGTGSFKGSGGYSLSSVVNKWYDLEISSNYFIDGYKWSHFKDSTNNTILGQLNCFFRCPTAEDILYIDSITVNYLSTDDFTINGQFSVTAETNGVYLYNPAQAESNSVPSGYTGSVLKLTEGTNSCVTINFSNSKIPLSLIENMNFRIYAKGTVSGNYPEFRLKPYNYDNRTSDVAMWPIMSTGSGGITLKNDLDKWFTFSVNTETITDNREWLNFADENDSSILGAFYLYFRTNTNTDALYIDSITLDLIDNDGVGPVIDYNYENIEIPAGSTLDINPTAFDASDNRYVEVTKTWIGNAPEIDSDGKILTQGTFTLKLSAKDYFGNETVRTVAITVTEPDLESPVINVPFETISLPVGTYFNINFGDYITDNKSFTFTVTYSDGTLDSLNRVLEGTHTATIIAIDLSGNSTTKVITIIGVGNYTPGGDITNEEELYGDYSVVRNFCVVYLKQNEISLDNHEYTGACLELYQPAKEAFNLLTDLQKDIFLNSGKFDDMVARFNAWATANGETIDFKNRAITLLNTNGEMIASNNIDLMIITMIIALAIAGGTLITINRKRKYFNK